MRFVSESPPRLISGADGSDPLPQTLVVYNYSLGWTVTHPGSVPHSVCVTSNIPRLSTLGAQRLVRVGVRVSYSRRYRSLQRLKEQGVYKNFLGRPICN